ncbi:putative endonuclease [Desulforamulus putei DSM 12395]|uniref:Putative endonuclease n=2 Tax=Desulforamulus putei TaxID=74701 RepID=A0A1M4SAU2_9FIRM|nr:putative endonuclease [Desulforamulus putei DSM 12395]
MVYMLECSDGCLYTGITNDLKRRLAMHRQGKASKFTRGRLPVKLVYFEAGYTKGQALSREKVIKGMTRARKLQLTQSFEP